MVNETNCPYCKSNKTVKRGTSPTLNRGKQQRYKCNTCKKTFIQNLGFWKMKNSPDKITAGIDLYFSSLSSRKVRNHFRRHYPHNASHVTVLDWCRKYASMVNDYTTTLAPKLDGNIFADETEIKRGKHNDMFWCSIDWNTRFINATLYSTKSQNIPDAVTLFRKVKKSVNPKFIQTDALGIYPAAFTKVFGSRKLRKNKCEHVVINFGKTGFHNVEIETVFMKIKDRVKMFRTLKSEKSAPILMQGIILQHNFVEDHTTTKKLPCDLAGNNPTLQPNRWLGLINQSCKI